MAPQPSAGQEISHLVAHRIAPAEVYVEFLRRSFEKGCARLSTGAAIIRVMGTDIDTIYVRPFSVQIGLHLVVDARQFLLGEIAPGQSGLVSDNDDPPASLIEHPDGFPRPRQQPELLRTAQVVDLLVDGAIAVQEDSACHKVWSVLHSPASFCVATF